MESAEIKYELPRCLEDKLRDRNTPYVFNRNAKKRVKCIILRCW